MENELLDAPTTRSYRKNLIYYIGSSLSIGSLLIFVYSTNIFWSGLVCVAGTVLIWGSPVKTKDKFYALAPLIGLIGTFLAYMYIFSLY